jgi:hypothetical protein
MEDRQQDHSHDYREDLQAEDSQAGDLQAEDSQEEDHLCQHLFPQLQLWEEEGTTSW